MTVSMWNITLRCDSIVMEHASIDWKVTVSIWDILSLRSRPYQRLHDLIPVHDQLAVFGGGSHVQNLAEGTLRVWPYTVLLYPFSDYSSSSSNHFTMFKTSNARRGVYLRYDVG